MELDKNNELKYRADYILNYYFIDIDNSFDERIQDWLCEDGLTQARDEALREIWDARVGYAEPDEYAYRSLDSIRERLGFTTKKRRSTAKRLLRFAGVAAVLVLILTGIVILIGKSGDGTQEGVVAETTYTTVEVDGIARKHIVLPDGSEVWVGSNSKITYPDSFESKRRVRITGSAYFSVHRDTIPFWVDGKNLHVKVLGTEFEVNSPENEGRSEVTLAKGEIEVTLKPNGEPLLMKPNEKLSFYDREGFIMVEEVCGSTIAPWKEVRLEFDDISLGEALNKISVYYGITFTIDGRIPLSGKITGRFTDNERLEEVLFVMGKITGKFRYEIEGEEVRLIRR